ncbi:helix-turn-helix transcriptional regulator [Aristaeella lactis]|uniref:Predicted DNA-binding transcriptional regulator YafY, contains an HTH and WYL domains n=1 Tax=Aristaeella lactis TaxID=3046383 RepID=A0AC61PLK7_9FIRM|nr:WYL domain-containing protein [Aristaeella lactis]QUA54652.1 WYL domain-containing protein [Aristaeella lactis]SMC63898.1 Predicted DNA-binding transcriptional regulator YafY, contains an HTH and WYL domains [Aristaeella lactis]
MADKRAIMFLYKYLYENTDEDHPISSVQLRAILRANGYVSDPRTIRKDIELLREAGYDILINEQNGIPTMYFYGARDWDKTELMILIDAISSAQFITKEKSREIINKLSCLAGYQNKTILTPSIFVSENLKAHNNQILYVLEKVTEAIREKKKISFKYYNYNTYKERIFRHDGELYTISPYSTIWKEDRYYVVGYSDKHEKIIPFRLDRMPVPKVIDEPAIPKPRTFKIQDYANKVTRMYTGTEYNVTLRCQTELIDNIIDKFGKDVQISNITKDTFDATSTVAVSVTFFGWVFQYSGKMIITSPECVRNQYYEMLQQSSNDTATNRLET